MRDTKWLILHPRMANPRLTGYLLGAIAAASYGMNPAFALPLYSDGMEPDSVLFLRYMTAVVILLPMALREPGGLRIKLSQGFSLAGLGVLMALSSLTLFASYQFMAAGIASTLLFVYPLMTAVIMAIFCHERASMITIFSIVMALMGISLLYRGDDGSTLSLVGTLLVFASALTYAIYLVGIAHWGIGPMPAVKLTFYVIFTGFLFFGVRILCAGALTVPQHWWYWGFILALAALPTAVSLLATTAAIQRIGSTPVAILGALEPVTAVIIGTLAFGEELTGRIIIGIAMIIGAVTLVIAQKKPSRKPTSQKGL